MASRGGGGGRKVLLPPINFIFRLLQQHAKVCIWLTEQSNTRIEGYIRGFDEFMNLVIDEAEEFKLSERSHDWDSADKRRIGRILLKGDNVGLIQQVA